MPKGVHIVNLVTYSSDICNASTEVSGYEYLATAVDEQYVP